MNKNQKILVIILLSCILQDQSLVLASANEVNVGHDSGKGISLVEHGAYFYMTWIDSDDDICVSRSTSGAYNTWDGADYNLRSTLGLWA